MCDLPPLLFPQDESVQSLAQHQHQTCPFTDLRGHMPLGSPGPTGSRGELGGSLGAAQVMLPRPGPTGLGGDAGCSLRVGRTLGEEVALKCHTP